MPDECSICLDEIVAATTGCVQLSCSHTYHLGCISVWYQKNPSCPECRSKPSEKETPPPSTSHWIEDGVSRMTNNSDRFIIWESMTRGHTPRLTGFRNLEAVVSSIDNQNTSSPDGMPEERRTNDVRIVSEQAGVSQEVASMALDRCQGDIVTAIMELSLGQDVATFELPENELTTAS
jgi:NACalpha-BTF3-like transcription factor